MQLTSQKKKTRETQPQGGQSWKPHTPRSDEPKITKTFSKPQSSELSAAGKNVRTAVKKPFVPAIVLSVPIADGQSVRSQFSYFDREVDKVQRRFNETFGRQVTINVQFRSKVMLAIINLMLLYRKIIIAKKPEAVRSEIARFVRCSRNLYGIFDQLEMLTQIRRNDHDEKQIA